MNYRFERKSFIPCVQVKLRFDQDAYPNLIKSTLRFMLDNNLYGIGSSSTGPGLFIEYFLPEDAARIEDFVEKHIKQVKKEKT